MMGCRRASSEVVVVPKVSTIVLKMEHAAHNCEGCCRRIRRLILKIKGVEQATVDIEKNRITVKGTMKKNGFSEYVSKKIRKRVKVVEPKPEERCNGQTACPGSACCGCNHCSSHHICRLPAVPPQFLSDENPNACAVM